MRTVLAFGDSNTHGTVATADPDARDRLAPGARWPDVAQAALGEGWTVIAEGQPGRTTVHADPVEGGHKSGADALPVLLETHRPIGLVAIMLGTNDLKARLAMSAADIALGLDRLVGIVRSSDAGPDRAAPLVLLIAPKPVSPAGPFADTFEGAAERSADLGAAIGTLARRRGVGFLDAGPVAEVDPVDGIHLTAEAHDRLGRAMADAVRGMWGDLREDERC